MRVTAVPNGLVAIIVVDPVAGPLKRAQLGIVPCRAISEIRKNETLAVDEAFNHCAGPEKSSDENGRSVD